ncbi:M56 family metallopeptidase [Acetivibrio cellulolyticus]|uniref:M56 family metallopeptidase n=1 Tax=Acetivibrio cellulolyticus TaxID=35830 RepID=UPI0001E2F06B|nr:peptidase m56 blar1 [Acetivibrio cellulolyticus]
MLENIFMSVLNMSLTAIVVAIMILTVRQMLKNKLPKVFSYAAWSILLVRLLVPVYFGAVFSIFNVLPASHIPARTNVSQNIGVIRYIPYNSEVQTNIGGKLQTKYSNAAQTNQSKDEFSSKNETSMSGKQKEHIDSKQVVMFLAAIVWILGTVILIAISVIMYLGTVKRLKTAVIYSYDRIVNKVSRRLKLRRKIHLFSSDVINTPIVCGLIKPRIILPLSLVQGSDLSALEHIVTHELIHIKRFDYLIKPLSVLAMCIHWFNPVIWLCFFLSQKDMEMSCDEKVIDVSDADIRSDYATSLINLSVRQNSYLNGGLLAFGESSIKSRIKGIMNYKKRGFWAIVITALALVTLGVVLLTNPNGGNTSSKPLENKGGNKAQTDVVKTKTSGMEIYLVKGSNQKYTSEVADLASLELENEPLLSKDDIISYNWDLHSVKIKNTGKITNELLQRRFVVVADGEKIYQGAFWSALYSMVPPEIGVYLDRLDEKSEQLILSLGSFCVGGEIQPNVKAVLDNMIVKGTLEREGKLFKPYNPKNFPLPDYISIFHNATQFSYADLDWERRDELIRLIDARFVNKLDYANYKFVPEDDNKMREKETIIQLNYKENIRGYKFDVSGKETEIVFNELLMPVTGSHNDLLYFRGNDNYPEFDYEYKHGYVGYSSAPIGKLEKFTNIDMLLTDYPKDENKAVEVKKGVYIWSYHRSENLSYELSDEEVREMKKAIKLGKEIKRSKKSKDELSYNTVNLYLVLGEDGEDWYHVCDDKQTIASGGKYYKNPVLAEMILELAKEKYGYEIFDTSKFKGIVKAKYSFRTNTRTYESTIEDKLLIEEIEKGLCGAKQTQAGGCPLDGLLTLTFSDGRTMDITMASDDCNWMFVDKNCLMYSRELHEFFEKNFDNFPYVRSR